MSTSLYLGGVSTIFKVIDEYSPFNAFLDTGEEIIEKFLKQNKEAVKEEEVPSHKRLNALHNVQLAAAYYGSEDSLGIYAMMEVIYDVSRGKEY